MTLHRQLPNFWWTILCATVVMTVTHHPGAAASGTHAVAFVVHSSATIEEQHTTSVGESPWSLSSLASATLPSNNDNNSRKSQQHGNNQDPSTKDDDDDNDSVISRWRQFTINTQGYHLIWSPGALKQIVLGSTVLLATDVVIGKALLSKTTVLRDTLFIHCHPRTVLIWKNAVLPLLASACCSVQLLLNLFAVGCAGFNTVLGPVRGYFVSLLLYTTIVHRGWNNTMATTTTCVRWTLALLPELLHLWNKQNHKPTALQESSSSPQSSLQNKMATVELAVPTMGCVACIHTIDTTLRRRIPAATHVSSWLNNNNNKTWAHQHDPSSTAPAATKRGGVVRVQVAVPFSSSETSSSTNLRLDETIDSLITAVEATGFPDATVLSVHVEDEAKNTCRSVDG